MRALKDYCLLAKGDFFHLFFEDSRAIMALPPRPSSQLDLNVPFQQAAIRSTAVRARVRDRETERGPGGLTGPQRAVPTGGHPLHRRACPCERQRDGERSGWAHTGGGNALAFKQPT
jgi:hypothetical protein